VVGPVGEDDDARVEAGHVVEVDPVGDRSTTPSSVACAVAISLPISMLLLERGLAMGAGGFEPP
jgi:hypothetical protein